MIVNNRLWEAIQTQYLFYFLLSGFDARAVCDRMHCHESHREPPTQTNTSMHIEKSSFWMMQSFVVLFCFVDSLSRKRVCMCMKEETLFKRLPNTSMGHQQI